MLLATTHHGPNQNPETLGEQAEALAWTAVHTAVVLALPGALASEPHKPLSAKPRALRPSLSHCTRI